MRTTIRLPDDLMRRVKRHAAESGRTLTAVIEEALREALARRDRPGPGPARVPTDGRGGVLPGVDLDDTRSLLDHLDRGERS